MEKLSPAASFLKRRDSWIREVVKDEKLSHPTVRVAIHLAMRMNGKKQSGAWPSLNTIAAHAGVSKRSVIYAIDELTGLNRKTEKWDGNRYIAAERKRNSGNRYWLNFWWE